MKLVNLNREELRLSDYDYGRTTIIIKVGRKLYYLDITIDSSAIFLDKYPYHKDGTKTFKYGVNSFRLHLKQWVRYLDRKFFEEFNNLSAAQHYLSGITEAYYLEI